MSFCCYLIIGNCVCYHKYNNSTSKIQKPQSKLPCGLFVDIPFPSTSLRQVRRGGSRWIRRRRREDRCRSSRIRAIQHRRT